MTGAHPIPVLPAISATILTAAALYFGSGIFAPVAVSLFLIAILWPMQKALESRIPRLLALLLTLAATVVVLFSFGWMISWGLGMVGRWLVANLGRFYALYAQTGEWLDGHGIFLTEQLGDRFNVFSLVRTFQDIAWRVTGLVGFSLWVLIFTMLGR